MPDTNQEFYKLISERPSVLFLGQEILAQETGTDPLLDEVIRKYPHRTEQITCQYDQLLIKNDDSSREHYFEWLRERTRRLNQPKALEIVGKFAWSSVFTSAIDNVGVRAFDQEWRELATIFEEKINPSDPRNRLQLHYTFLFGSVARIDLAEQAPVTPLELIKRRQVAVALARRIPESVSPLGALVIEGYNPKNDWLKSEDFYPILDKLSARQIHIFSVSDEFSGDDYIQELVNVGKAVLYYDSLATVLNRGKEHGFLEFGVPGGEVEARNSLSLRDGVVQIPLDIRTLVNKSATILDDGILIQPPAISNEREYYEFREFLSNSGVKPIWKGYARGFAFRRDYEKAFQSLVKQHLSNAGNVRKPLILHGQTGTGKTISCGALAYQIKKEKQFPVLFIEKRTNKPNYRDISTFCEWSESCGAEATLIVWDGMLDIQQYDELVKFLLSRGKKSVVVGTTYKLDTQQKSDFLLEAPDKFQKDEINRLRNFIAKFDANSRGLDQALSNLESSTFLVALYRLLPASRPKVQSGVVEEVGRTKERILATTTEAPIKPFYSSLASALMKAGVADDVSITLDEISEIDGQQTTRLEEVIGLIMVPGMFGINVPLELLARAFGDFDVQQLIKILSKSDVFRWIEDEVGNIYIGPRQALEAILLIRSWFGNPATEIEYAKKLLLEIRNGSISFENTELNFGIELLRNLGPNGPNKEHYRPYFLQIVEILRELRTSRGIVNSRLMLQESFFIREYVIKSNLESEEAIELLDRAESTLQDALAELPDEKRQNKLRSFLLVEIASTLGAKVNTIITKNCLYEELPGLAERIRGTVQEARGLDPDGFRSLDVLFWTSRDMLECSDLDSVTRSNVIADVFDAIDSIKDTDLSDPDREKFEVRRWGLSDLLDLSDMNEMAFEELKARGSTAGYYLQARKILGSVDLAMPLETELEILACKEACDYLEGNAKAISNDGKCLYLHLRLWWQSKSYHPLFFEERQTVPFNEQDWRFILRHIELLIQTGEYHRRSALLYLQALAFFHLRNIQSASGVFKEISFEPEETQGRRRIIRSYLACNPDGTAQVFSGNVNKIDDIKGEVYVEELGTNVRFFKSDFGRSDIRRGEPLPRFHIAFNFIGMLADPIRKK